MSSQFSAGFIQACSVKYRLLSQPNCARASEMILGQPVGSYSIKPDLGWMNLTLLLRVTHLISGYPVLGLTRDSGRVLKGAGAIDVLDV